MKRYIHHIILGAALLLMSAGCARYDEDRLAIGGDRVPLSDLSMDFMVDGADVYTKAGQSVLAENRVTGLYVLLFDAQGYLVHRKSYFVGGGDKPDRYDAQIISYTEKKSEDGGASMGIIPGFFEDYSGDAQSLQGQFTFYAVANYNETVGKQLEEVKEESQLQNMTVKFVTNGNVFRSNFLMVATEKNVRFSAVDNDNGGVTVERIGVTLRLRRVDAKVSFRVTVDIPGARNVAFEDMIYRVHNVPNVTYLIERQKGVGDAWDASAAGKDYSCMMDETYDTFDTTYTDRVGGEFAFYLRETRLDPERRITSADKGDRSSLYALREAWDNENENVSGKTPVHGGGRTYTYAPEYGTFVEITGNLSYSRINENGQEEQVDGDVTYIIHLGETGNDPDDEDAVNNYDVRRNVRYIYNVNIKGINDMEVEVTEQDELRPGVEGDLVISTNRKVEMDAHYGRVLLTLDKNNLKEAGWSAVTPLGTIEYNPETGQINAPYDYKWVLFAINRHFDPDLEWTQVMTTDQRIENADGLKQDYRDALHACITRNRDLNGNNRIDEDEIYWYLASEAQLSGLFIGQPSLSQDAWLYQGDGSEYSHVVSSTSSNMKDRGSYRILWAEEGASWGYISGELQSYRLYDYRCVRNLGIDIAKMEQSPAHYASVTESSNYFTVDVGYLNDRALRSAPDDGINLPLDHERSQNNRPYAKFDVRKEVVYDGPVWLEMRDMLLRNENPCPEGWRVPNQREMLIMMSTLTSEFDAAVDWNGNYGIATTFSFNGTGLYSPQSGTVRDERWGFLTENTNLVLYNPYDPNSGEARDSNKKLKFRCVKDNTDR